MTEIKLLHADCLEAMRAMEADSIDAIVTDPPYGLEFMGKGWDAPWKNDPRSDKRGVVDPKAWGGNQDSPNGGNPYSRARIRTGAAHYGKDSAQIGQSFQAWATEWAREALRVAKPGAHLVAFGGTRTFHRLACAIEDAGWEVRDCLSWLYGSGFPKSLDVSKAIDKAAGAEREVVGFRKDAFGDAESSETEDGRNLWGKPSTKQVALRSAAPATDDARTWQGWGTALKPAWEPIILARKPLVSTVASNVLAHGTGALNIDGCRIETADNLNGGTYSNANGRERASAHPGDKRSATAAGAYARKAEGEFVQPSGRWPANVVLSHTLWCEHETKDGREVWSCDEGCPVKMLDAQTGTLTSGKASAGGHIRKDSLGATGGAALGGNSDVSLRSREEAGVLYGDSGGASRFFYTAKASRRERGEGNTHPTVKPIALMRWISKLICPPGGTILDPFAGSGTTLLAAQEEGFSAVGIEREAEYVEIAKKRIERTGR